MRPRQDLGSRRPRLSPRRGAHDRLPYQAPRLMEFDEDLRRRCAQIYEELGHLLHCLKCEDMTHPAQLEKPGGRLDRFDPHYWG